MKVSVPNPLFENLSRRSFLMHYVAPSSPPKEESKPKDTTEPADQQVNKSLPKESAPSTTDKVTQTPSQVKDKAVEKSAAPKREEKSAAPKREEKSKPETPRPAAGSRGETRVTSCLFS